jgi:hypothetical protein
MTQKYLELVAKVIRELNVKGPTRVMIAKAFADAIAPTNERFDRLRFLVAATREHDTLFPSD